MTIFFIRWPEVQSVLMFFPPVDHGVRSNILFSCPAQLKQMKPDTRWKLGVGAVLVTLSIVLYVAHYLIFHDEHHLFIFFIGDLAFVPVEVLIVTLIIDQMLESREKEQRIEKLNMVIGTFFSTLGTSLLSRLSHADPGISTIEERWVIGKDWKKSQFDDVLTCLDTYKCSVRIENIDMEALRNFLFGHEDFLLRIIENPMIFEHESFTDLILAVDHLTKEMKARGDLGTLPSTDQSHLESDIRRVYERLIPEWLKYMEYLKAHYPYLFSLAMRTNPFDSKASVVIHQD
jgi:hypothetical protein